jgi:Large-conductance mechanosensitive channel, MscL
LRGAGRTSSPPGGDRVHQRRVVAVSGLAARAAQLRGSGLLVHGSTFAYGDFINAALSFLIIATVVYYFVVAPTNRLAIIATRNTDAAQRPCPECLSDIPVAAKRCRFCTATVVPAVNGQAVQVPHAVVRRPRAAAHRQRSI